MPIRVVCNWWLATCAHGWSVKTKVYFCSWAINADVWSYYNGLCL